MNADEFRGAAIPAMTDETILPVNITISDAWMIVSALQLTVRHPDLHEPLRNRLTDIAHQFQSKIAELHPEADEALNMGWSEEYDDLDIDDEGREIGYFLRDDLNEDDDEDLNELGMEDQ